MNLWARPVIAVGRLMWFVYVDAEVRAPVFACRYIVDEMATRIALDEGEKFFNVCVCIGVHSFYYCR